MTTSEQARADAMADAETFRQRPALSPLLLHAYPLLNTIMVACQHNAPFGYETLAANEARRAARAAFRAVPGLRG